MVSAFCLAFIHAKDRTYVYKYGEVMSSSLSRAKLGDVCFSLFASMDAGDFFKGLEYRKKTANHFASEFRKNGQIVSVFPEELQIGIGFQTVPCTGTKQPELSPAQVDDLLRSIDLQVSWKSGLEYRSAKLVGPPVLLAKPVTIQKVVGEMYTLHVRARGVPITDHLVVSVLDPDKRVLTHVTFSITVDLLPPTIPREP